MTDISYVRKEMAPSQPAPASTVGPVAWARKNLFASIPDTILTLVSLWLIWLLVPPLIEFAFVNAVWSGENREACIGQDGACWAYVKAYLPQFIYGRYPDPERWRVNLTFLLFFGGLIPMMIPSVPFKRENVIYMLVVFPTVALVLLTGGNMDFNGFLLPDTVIAPSMLKFWVDYAILTAIVMAAAAGIAKASQSRAAPAAISVLVIFGVLAAIMVVLEIDFGLRPVPTELWGGLLVTLVIAVTGIAVSLPLGVALALGRRSKMPIVRLVSIIFIEFWRGVPLITVLFMSSVMLPLFVPENLTIDKLLRALIGVALFAAAYMAEVIRGGLQAIPKGQYEGAQALGLTYWQMMYHIILPQALKLVIPGIVNTFIGLFKDTTLVLIIGLFDLLGQVQSSFTDPNWSSPYQSHTGYLFAATIFWIFCFGMSRYSVWTERRLDTGHKKR
ncbi:MAG: amino acid ABC transporter permease [Rhodobiaceae bacterium]|nr:amino acid ABC transporter permease [Rhodobiaceae bacterium]MCC0057076.1 amino acid ABC transporter permease [Rhodobiaceae bacterium]